MISDNSLSREQENLNLVAHYLSSRLEHLNRPHFCTLLCCQCGSLVRLNGQTTSDLQAAISNVSLLFFNLDPIFPCLCVWLTGGSNFWNWSSIEGERSRRQLLTGCNVMLLGKLAPPFTSTKSVCFLPWQPLIVIISIWRWRRSLVLKSGEVTCCWKTTLE